MSTKPTKPDDTAQLINQARAFSQQFGALTRVAGMLDRVGSLRDELADLAGQREKAMHELNVLFGEKDAELKALTQQIEDRVRSEHAEAERVVAREAEARRSFENLKVEIAERNAVLTGLEGRIMRAEGQYGEISTKLSQLRGAIPQGA
jgi:chromosome segregation ATPase